MYVSGAILKPNRARLRSIRRLSKRGRGRAAAMVVACRPPNVVASLDRSIAVDDHPLRSTEALALVSHDMRTPLTVVSALTTLLLADKAGSLQPLQREFLTSIQLGVKQLTRLAEHILDLYQAETGELRIRRDPLQTAGIMVDVVERMRLEAAKAGIRLECAVAPELPLVHADRRRFEQVLTNLLGCAIRATSEGGRVSVKAERNREDLKVVVESSGAQLPAPETGREGDAPGRWDTTVCISPEGKPALALQVSKLILEHHGGRLWVEAGQEARMRFCFALQGEIP